MMLSSSQSLGCEQDNAGGGAAGDSTYILRRLIERNVVGAVLGGLWDPIAVEFCHRALLAVATPAAAAVRLD